jgi:ribosomal protein S12
MASLAKLLTCVQAKMKRDRNKALMHCPKVCTRIYNNAQKPKFWAEKIQLINQSKIIAQIPGIGHNLQEHSCVLVRADVIFQEFVTEYVAF